MASGHPLGNNPAASPELTARYSKLYLEYKLAVNAAHLADQRPGGGGPVFEWQGPAGISASAQPPLQSLLAAPRLPPDLQQYLQPQQAQQPQPPPQQQH